MVYKDGATTGLMIGKELVCVRHEFVPNWGGSQIMAATLDENLGIDNQFGPPQHRWIGYVKPIAGLGWSTNGDSGALVYALKDSVKIPLGIHIGKPLYTEASTGLLSALKRTCLLQRKRTWRCASEPESRSRGGMVARRGLPIGIVACLGLPARDGGSKRTFHMGAVIWMGLHDQSERFGNVTQRFTFVLVHEYFLILHTVPISYLRDSCSWI
jgi:hypothetical protein